mgnify:CR=1 FL=1
MSRRALTARPTATSRRSSGRPVLGAVVAALMVALLGPGSAWAAPAASQGTVAATATIDGETTWRPLVVPPREVGDTGRGV